MAVSPVTDKTAVKLRYERAVAADEEIKEENEVKSEFAINTNVRYGIQY